MDMTKTILVVDDKASVRQLVRDYLTEQGYKVVTASNGREALYTARHENPDAILLDIMMPEMDGYETMRAIRENPRFRHLPIIAVTAKAMKGDRQKCLDAGASDYIAKPVDIELLLALLRVWVARAREESQPIVAAAE